MLTGLINKSMFPEPESRLKMTDGIDELLNIARLEIAENSTVPSLDMKSFRSQLKALNFELPQDMLSVVQWVLENLETGTVHVTHPGYMGLFNPAPTFASEVADKIMAAINPQLCVWSHAPVAVEIEAHVIHKLNQKIGFDGHSGGHFTSGGSEANATAFLCALTSYDSRFAEMGAQVFSGHPKIYVSAESHLAWLKIAHQTGVGRRAIELVKTDGYGRMDATELQRKIINDQQIGNHPVMIAATAGTTNAGMIDPLVDCAHLAKEFGMWFHVDAAWGGAMVASDARRDVLAGLDLADSVTIDAHKWFAVTMGTGMFLTKKPKILAETFKVTASYMPSNDYENDLYVNSIQWSRRFAGLRLFMSLAVAGWHGYEQHIEHSIGLSKLLGQLMIEEGWKVVNDSEMAIVCLRPPEKSASVESIVSEVNRLGKQWVSAAKFEGETVIRACITNGMTEKKHVKELANKLIEINQSLLKYKRNI